MAAVEVDAAWQSAFPDKERPELYANTKEDEDGFFPLNDPQNFVADINGLNHVQLYATSINNQQALKDAQDEYLDIARAIAAVQGKDSNKDPRKLQDPELYEERKEATLYGYKYEAPKPVLLQNGIPGLRVADEVSEQEKRDVRYFQEPFQQGGFVPTDKQYKAMLAKSKNPANPDGWKPVERAGKPFLPVQQTHHDEYTLNYVRRRVNEDGELIRPDSEESDDSIATPSKLVNKRLTRTRFGGKKVPPTRDVSESPSVASTPGRKRRGTPATDDREGTPASKRQRFNGTEKIRHHNQYTKAKEIAGLSAERASAGGAREANAPHPVWSQLTTKEMRARKWNDKELVHAIKQDHTWLHDDPNKAADWKDKIVNGTNPVRSYSMLMKWAYWKVENKDKRPRGKKDVAGKEKSATPKGSRAPVRRKLQNAAKERASESPFPERSIDGDSFKSVESGGRPQRRGRSGLGIGALINYEEPEDDLQPETETEVEDTTEETFNRPPAWRSMVPVFPPRPSSSPRTETDSAVEAEFPDRVNFGHVSGNTPKKKAISLEQPRPPSTAQEVVAIADEIEVRPPVEQQRYHLLPPQQSSSPPPTVENGEVEWDSEVEDKGDSEQPIRKKMMSHSQSPPSAEEDDDEDEDEDENTGSEITVNGEVDEDTNWKGSRKLSPAGTAPTRRSLRNSRRGSS